MNGVVVTLWMMLALTATLGATSRTPPYIPEIALTNARLLEMDRKREEKELLVE